MGGLTKSNSRVCVREHTTCKGEAGVKFVRLRLEERERARRGLDLSFPVYLSFYLSSVARSVFPLLLFLFKESGAFSSFFFFTGRVG